MDMVMGFVNFAKEHWVEVLAVIGGVDIILGVVVKWSKPTWDDSAYAIVHSWISKLGVKK
jgi:hypothetical protein